MEEPSFEGNVIADLIIGSNLTFNGTGQMVRGSLKIFQNFVNYVQN